VIGIFILFTAIMQLVVLIYTTCKNKKLKSVRIIVCLFSLAIGLVSIAMGSLNYITYTQNSSSYNTSVCNSFKRVNLVFMAGIKLRYSINNCNNYSANAATTWGTALSSNTLPAYYSSFDYPTSIYFIIQNFINQNSS